jgi:hypothetical protein
MNKMFSILTNGTPQRTTHKAAIKDKEKLLITPNPSNTAENVA